MEVSSCHGLYIYLVWERAACLEHFRKHKFPSGIESLSWSGSLKVDRVPEILFTLYKISMTSQTSKTATKGMVLHVQVIG